MNDGRIGIAVTYCVGTLWVCHMDAMPQFFRRFAALVTTPAGLGLWLILLCVHYEFFPNLRDHSFTIFRVTWSLKQTFASSGFIVALYFTRYSIHHLISGGLELIMARTNMIPELIDTNSNGN